MHFNFYLISTFFVFRIQTTHSNPNDVSTDILEKLRSIRQWLDTTHDATVYDYIYRVNKGAGLNLFEGDIKGFNPRFRTAVTNHNLLWNSRIVPYLIDPAFDSSSRKEILAAIEEFNKKTCLRFVPRTSESDYISIKQIRGCYSNIGRRGGEQEVSLTDECLKTGTAIHELMHVLGFWHEQNRPDRDLWVQIIRSNIQTGMEYNFDKLSQSEVDTLHEQYDYGSIMHYSKYAFSKNGNPTIIPIRKTSAELGQREEMSEHDIHRIHTLYRCDSYAVATPGGTMTPPTRITNVTGPVTMKNVSPYPVNSSTENPPNKTSVYTAKVTSTSEIPSSSSLKGASIPTTSFSASSLVSTTMPTVTSGHSSGWTSWSQWTQCNLQCIQFRYRFCLSPSFEHCPGNRTEQRDCPSPCKPAFLLGCWQEISKSPYIPSVEEMDITLNDPYKQRTMAVQKCADYAARNGYTVFAVFDGGMCRTGPTAHLAYSYGGPSRKCTDKGTGSNDANSVYTFLTDVDGGWSEWTSWSQCTKSCNIGQKYRFRSCDNPPPMGNGTSCQGSRREVVVCNLQACPVNNKCGRPFYIGGAGDSGYIWVRDYEDFMECEYHIMAIDALSTISLLIQDMEIEFSKGCIYDSLMLYDGRNSLSTFVKAFCGQSSPGSFESSTNHVYLKFESDETKSGGGFTIFYAINNRSKKACVQPTPSPPVIITSEGNMVGDRLFYTCHHGYTLVGHSPITCIDQPNFALWDDVYPRCIASRKRSVNSIWQENLCTFDNSLCGFRPHPGSNFNWIVELYGDNGVLLTKSSRIQAPGDVSGVISGEQHCGTGSCCLDFRYIIDGGEASVLNVYIVRNDTRYGLNNSTLVWTKHGTNDEDLDWKKVFVEIRKTLNFKIMFETVLWEELGSQVLIDDVRISPEKCSV